ncbi:serine protease [Lasius niger]|uniref:Serine protease HTRA2, mitochondrial n=1 Tax=Lasius niger TaxID=67767 RepID=A0A0J7KLA2_LASNI|nr:serine protease [Lasius niger]
MAWNEAQASLLSALTSSSSDTAKAGTDSKKIDEKNSATVIRPHAQTAGVPDFVPLVKSVKPAVVSVSATIKETGQEEGGEGPSIQMGPPQGGMMPFGFPFPFMMPGMPGMMQQPPHSVEAKGSGFLISADGYVVTNFHVVSGATKVSVQLDNGRSYSAKIVGKDSKTDVALLKIKPDAALPYLELGESEELNPGQWIVAVGDPYGLGGTVTAGIVSAMGRDLHSGAYNDFIQLDAPINRGNSGGPLLTLNGKVVGMNAMILSPNGGGSIGIGFAIPSDTVSAVVKQLRKTGHVVRGYLGVAGQDLTPALAEAMGIKSKSPTNPAEGALVASVTTGSPADKAGIKNGDVVVSVSGKAVKNAHDLAVKVSSLPPGTKTDISVIRANKTLKLSFTTGDLSTITKNGEDGAANSGKIGLTLSPLNPHIRQEIGLDENVQGVAVVEVGGNSIALRSGIRPGDVILEVNSHPVTTPKAAASFIAQSLSGKKPILFQILRDGQHLYMAINGNLQADEDLSANSQGGED